MAWHKTKSTTYLLYNNCIKVQCEPCSFFLLENCITAVKKLIEPLTRKFRSQNVKHYLMFGKLSYNPKFIFVFKQAVCIDVLFETWRQPCLLPRPIKSIHPKLRPCPKRRLRLQLRLDRARLLFFNTGRRADLDVAVAEVVVSDTAWAWKEIVVWFPLCLRITQHISCDHWDQDQNGGNSYTVKRIFSDKDLRTNKRTALTCVFP